MNSSRNELRNSVPQNNKPEGQTSDLFRAPREIKLLSFVPFSTSPNVSFAPLRCCDGLTPTARASAQTQFWCHSVPQWRHPNDLPAGRPLIERPSTA
jgi:hypothetical protein